MKTRDKENSSIQIKLCKISTVLMSVTGPRTSMNVWLPSSTTHWLSPLLSARASISQGVSNPRHNCQSLSPQLSQLDTLSKLFDL